MPKIYWSHRAGDEQALADRVLEALRARTPNADASILTGAGSAPLGANVAEHIEGRVATSDIMLALIGPGWLDARDASGARRLDDPRDPVRLEIAAALKRGIPVAPVVLEGASLPAARDLPDILHDLSIRSGVALHTASFDADMDVLMNGIGGVAPVRRHARSQSAARSSPSGEKRKSPLGLWLAGGSILAVAAAAILLTGESADKTFANVAASMPATPAKPALAELAMTVEATTVVLSHITSLAFSRDGGTVLIGDDEGSATFWRHGETNPYIAKVNIPDKQLFVDIASTPDARRVLGVWRNGHLTFWSSPDGKEIATRDQGATAVEFSPDGSKILLGLQSGSVVLIDTETGTNILTVAPSTKSISDVAFSPDGSAFLAGTAEGAIKLLSTKDGVELASFQAPLNPDPDIAFPRPAIESLAFMSDGGTFLSGSEDGTVALWLINQSAPVKTWQDDTDGVTAVRFSSDGLFFYTATSEKIMKWSVADLAPVATLTGAGGQTAAAFSEDGKRIVTANATAVTIHTLP